MSLFDKIARIFKRKRPEPAAPLPGIDDDVGTDGAGDSAPLNTSGITRFCYRYNGSIGGNSYSYDVDAAETPAKLTLWHMEHPEYGEPETPLDPAFLAELERLYRDLRLSAWNGFNKSNPYVCDGDGFSLNITFADGSRLSAHGTNSFPKNYRNFRQRLDALFAPEVEKLHEAARQQHIDAGLQGSLESFLATFIQHGASGSDRYEALVTKQGVRQTNFDVRIKSRSGEFVPAGEYTVYRNVPDEAIGFEAFDALVRKHGLIRWYNYDKAAPDYNDQEWFQLSLDFGEDNINACGTEHPEGYDAFRREFLTLLVSTALNIRDKYPEASE